MQLSFTIQWRHTGSERPSWVRRLDLQDALQARSLVDELDFEALDVVDVLVEGVELREDGAVGVLHSNPLSSRALSVRVCTPGVSDA